MDKKAGPVSPCCDGALPQPGAGSLTSPVPVKKSRLGTKGGGSDTQLQDIIRQGYIRDHFRYCFFVCTKDPGTKVPSGISRFVYPTRGHPSRSAYRTPVTAIMEWPHQRYKTPNYPDKQYKKYKRDSIIEFSREGRAFSSDFLIFCLDFMNFTGVVNFLF